MRPPIDWVQILTAIGLAGTGLALLFAARAGWEAHRARYLILRRSAARQARRWLAVALGFALGTAALNGAVRWGIPSPLPIPPPLPPAHLPTPPPPGSPTPSPGISPLEEAPPTAIPTSTMTPSPAPSPAPSPTATALPYPPTLLTPLPGALPAPPNARLVDLVLSDACDERGRPQRIPQPPPTVFPTTTTRICGRFRAENMPRGAPWTVAWYRDGALEDSSTLLWDGAPNQPGFIYNTRSQGFPPGIWEVRLYIEDRLQIRLRFEVR